MSFTLKKPQMPPPVLVSAATLGSSCSSGNVMGEPTSSPPVMAGCCTRGLDTTPGGTTQRDNLLTTTWQRGRVGQRTQSGTGAKRGYPNSIVWLGFQKADADQTTINCKICCKQIVTSNLTAFNRFYHLKTRYEDKTNCHSFHIYIQM